MKSVYIIVFLFLFSTISLFAQEPQVLYHPDTNAQEAVRIAIDQAKKEHKNVLIMIGGNWCRWCKMFDKFVMDNADVDSTLKSNFVFQHVNFSKENRKLDLMTQWDFPQRFGFPVFVVLNDKGQRIHTQNSAYLEKGEGYDAKVVMDFFGQWGTAVMKPELYLEK